MFKIALDAGHGLYTPGKRCLQSIDPNETREWVLNDRICDKVEKKLGVYDGYSLIRVDDTTGKIDVPLADRVKKANDFGADIYMSVHQNAGVKGGSGGGAIVIVDTTASNKSKEYQKIIYDELIKKTGLKGNRSTPTPQQSLYVCKHTKMPAILVECGFMDSSIDVPIILSEDFADKAAEAFVNSLVKIGKLTKRDKFADIKGHYAENHIRKLINYNIVYGYEDGTFKPNNDITRAELSSMMVNTLEKVCGCSLNAVGVFPDTIGHWAEVYINKLSACKIVNGYDDGTFKPNNTATRGQAAIMACNMLSYCGIKTQEGQGYPDIAGHYAEHYIRSLAALKVVNGYDDGMFRPDTNITRGQVAIIIANCLTILGK